MKYDIQFTNQFKKDLKLAKKQNKNLDKLFEVIGILANGGTLDAKYRDHDLTGNYKGTRECHIEPDWLSCLRNKYKSGIWKGMHCHAEKVELFFKHRYWFINRSFHWIRNL